MSAIDGNPLAGVSGDHGPDVMDGPESIRPRTGG